MGWIRTWATSECPRVESPRAGSDDRDSRSNFGRAAGPCVKLCQIMSNLCQIMSNCPQCQIFRGPRRVKFFRRRPRRVKFFSGPVKFSAPGGPLVSNSERRVKFSFGRRQIFGARRAPVSNSVQQRQRFPSDRVKFPAPGGPLVSKFHTAASKFRSDGIRVSHAPGAPLKIRADGRPVPMSNFTALVASQREREQPMELQLGIIDTKLPS